MNSPESLSGPTGHIIKSSSERVVASDGASCIAAQDQPLRGAFRPCMRAHSGGRICGAHSIRPSTQQAAGGASDEIDRTSRTHLIRFFAAKLQKIPARRVSTDAVQSGAKLCRQPGFASVSRSSRVVAPARQCCSYEADQRRQPFAGKVNVCAECTSLYKGLPFVRQHARNPVPEGRPARHRRRVMRSIGSRIGTDRALAEK